MAISRQSDSIWVESAMGYGHSHSPARDEDHHKAGQAARDHGESMGRKHANETIDHYNRDERGRFAPMPHHEKEHDDAAGKIARHHRDEFHEGYHRGFHGRIKEHEKDEKAKANKHSAYLAATDYSELDPGRIHYMLGHGMSDEGYVEPTWLEKMLGGENQDEKWDVKQPTEKNPYRYDVGILKGMANDKDFGLNLGMSDKAPFSRNDVGLGSGDLRRKENRGYATLRNGELASRPIKVEDHLGNVHTFVHQITAPNLNEDPEKPGVAGPWVVSVHHHVLRPDGSADWLPSEVTHHVHRTNAVNGRASDDLNRDIHGALTANSDMVTMYGAGAQRIGDKDTEIKYEFPHPDGDVVYRAQLANGWNKYDGYYFDPLLKAKHPERISDNPRWIVTGHALERMHAHDPNSPTRMVMVEGSDRPNKNTISFDKDDLHKVIDHVWTGLGANPAGPSWRRFPQHQLPNTGGLPPEKMVRGSSSLPPWEPEHNIHRSAERLPITF